MMAGKVRRRITKNAGRNRVQFWPLARVVPYAETGTKRRCWKLRRISPHKSSSVGRAAFRRHSFVSRPAHRSEPTWASRPFLEGRSFNDAVP